jgi:hypothetical protein
MTQPNWLQRLKRDHIDPIVESISDNLPIIVATATTAVAVGIALKASNDAEHTKEVLASIEEKINTAIEAPTIVRVELGDDFELYGQGNRTD